MRRTRKENIVKKGWITTTMPSRPGFDRNLIGFSKHRADPYFMVNRCPFAAFVPSCIYVGFLKSSVLYPSGTSIYADVEALPWRIREKGVRHLDTVLILDDDIHRIFD